jgi:hypothetical protein
MKKILCVLLVALTLLSMVACQGSEPTTAKPATPTTTAKPTSPTDPEPTTSPTVGGPKELVLSEVYTKIISGVEMPDMMPVDADIMLDMFGIQAAQCKQAQVYLCVNSLRADEIWLIEATDEAALAQLKQMAQNRLTAKDEESVTYSPEQNAIVKKAHLETYGNYLVMIVSPDVETIAAAFKAEAGV